MRSTERKVIEAAAVLARWCVKGTTLSCVAGVQPGPAAIRMPACVVRVLDDPCGPQAVLLSECGSFVLLADWVEASEVRVQRSARGTKIEVTYDDGAVVIADYDCC